jgi:hypothetical protein
MIHLLIYLIIILYNIRKSFDKKQKNPGLNIIAAIVLFSIGFHVNWNLLF